MRDARFVVSAMAAACCVVTASTPAQAATVQCQVVQVEMVPTDDLQIAIWIEDANGDYIDTLFLTQLTGTYGLGNRPGILDFDSAWRWPYGRRESVLPVWAHRHGAGPVEGKWPLLIFQNSGGVGDVSDSNLSHPAGQSSNDSFYCRPLKDGEAMWDTQTCASVVATDKGKNHATALSLYPPRTDISYVEGIDHPDVANFAAQNPFDAVSRATPVGGQPFLLSSALVQSLPAGDYVLLAEVNKEYDQNMYYSFSEPIGIPWSDYGLAYRGQPSTVYRVTFTIGGSDRSTSTRDYHGYGDPDGLDGNVRVPDVTISTDVPGSGASRLQLVSDGDDMYRLRLSTRDALDAESPGGPGDAKMISVSPDQTVVEFLAPGDDGDVGRVTSYEIRYLAGRPITDDNFLDGETAPAVTPLDPGQLQSLTISGLLPETNYYIGIRALDECATAGPLAVVHVQTPPRTGGKVDACFVATAAYGSMMAADVKMLRSFRDTYLRSNLPGELFVESYYTVGPALSGLIGGSDTARRAARAALGPLVDLARDLMTPAALP